MPGHTRREQMSGGRPSEDHRIQKALYKCPVLDKSEGYGIREMANSSLEQKTNKITLEHLVKEEKQGSYQRLIGSCLKTWESS